MDEHVFGVVGAGYGDEGKGMLTDWLAAAHPGATVVRSNGGAQAGHSVRLRDGRRHVFHHLGSGALAGAPTHLGRRFVHHPMLLTGERDAVAALGGDVRITADPRGLVTTPYDMLINQIVERARGAGRHGSCGLGFGEAIERGLHAAYRLTLEDIGVSTGLLPRLTAIRDEWVPRRLAALGVRDLAPEDRALLGSSAMIERFVDDLARFVAHVEIRGDATLGAGQVVFEGAQGLMLDQDWGVFPHVTRSRTGARNMVEIAAEAGIARIDVVYATRCYVTRHGAGPLAHERDRLDFAAVVDPTNVPNPWQGNLRFGLLDLDVLADAVSNDLARAAASGVEIRPSVAVTCLDQLTTPCRMVDGGREVSVPADAVGAHVAARLSMPLIEARGPSRETVAVMGPAATSRGSARSHVA